jgi:hypothetical protein
MSPLNIHPEEEVTVPKKKKNKSLQVMLGIAALIAVPVVGTTLAASITIGTDNAAINFGQGVVQTTACDSAVVVTAASSFTNATGSGSFKTGDVTITGISSDCYTKQFIVTLYPDTSTSIGSCTITNYSGATVAGAADVSATNCNSGTAGVQFTSTKGSGTDGTIVVKFGSASTPIAATNVYKVTVESS